MLKQLNSAPVAVAYAIEVEPDLLIELGHRLKAAAMDAALPGQSVTVPLTNNINLVYNPEREFIKPAHKAGYIQYSPVSEG